MTRTADELVTEFCKLWSSPDPEVLARVFTEDAVYHNIPMEPVEGRKDGGEIPLPVMGVFEIRDDRIAMWRDYFDMAAITKAFS